MKQSILDTVVDPGLWLMIVEDDPGVGYAVARCLKEWNVRSALVTSASEAMDLLRDANFIDAAFDGLLVDYHLGDATGARIIQELREEFPSVPVALMTGSIDISLEMWTRARSIPLFHKPLNMDEIRSWVRSIRQTA